MSDYDPEIMEMYVKYVPMPNDGNVYILLGHDWLFKWVIYKYKCVCKVCSKIFFDEEKKITCKGCDHKCVYAFYKKYDSIQDKTIKIIGCICGSHFTLK